MNTKHPSLDKLIFEYCIIKGGINLSKRRIEGQSKLPSYIFKTLSVLTRAYILTALKYFPSNLKNRTEILRRELNELKDMYHNQ